MLLAIDVGNTNITCGLFEGDDLVKQWRMETYGEWDFIEAQDFDAIYIGSVVPEVDAKLQALFDIDPVFVSAENSGVEIGLDQPEHVGADRLINTAAVIVHYEMPAIVIDFGTATTFDIIDEDGVYKGGVIAPGPRLSLAALEQATAKLPEIEIEKPDSVIGKDTVHAMQSGLFYGYLGMLEGLVSRLKEEIYGDPMIITTGGLASFFYGETDFMQTIDPDLTLKGLHSIYKRTL